MIIQIVLWAAASLLFMCFVEYVVHRWPMHDKRFVRRFPWLWETFESHAVLHHGRYFKEFDREDEPAARYISIELSGAFELVGLAPLWVPLLLSSTIGGVTLAVVAGLHGLAWTAMHREMHFPKQRWFHRTAIYRYVRDYHHTHHLHPGTNFNAVLPPLADLVFGTYRSPGPLAGEGEGVNGSP